MESLAYITRNLEDKLECHSINEIQYKVEHTPMLSKDPFNLPNSVQWIITIAEKELKYAGCYLACKNRNMEYMYRGMFQGNRLYIAATAALGSGEDHGRFFVQAVLAFACNDYELIKKILPMSAGLSKNSYWKIMANLLMAVFYKDDNIKSEAVAGAMEYLKRKRKSYERLICEYLIAILNKNTGTAGECLEKLCGNITKAAMIQEECVSDVTRVELSKAICLFGHGLCGAADYYLPEEIYGRMRLPDADTFLVEYEDYRARHKNSRQQALVIFLHKYSFLNDVIWLLPDISFQKGEPYTDADSFKSKLFERLYDGKLLSMVQEAEQAEWIAKWGSYERFLNFFNPGDECKIYYGRGLIYYALSNPDPDERYRVSRFLLERQCDVSRVKNGFDGPFHYLFRQKKYDMTQTIELCRMLLENGADPNQAGERNYLPVSCLIMMNVPEKELISLLKFWLGQQGLNMTLRTFEGLTPLDIAKKYGKKRCEDEIKKYIDCCG